jgi:hypothetical protein
MSALTPRLLALLRSCAAAYEQNEGDAARLGEQFHGDMQLMIARYGHQAVAAALNEMPDGTWPSVSVH